MRWCAAGRIMCTSAGGDDEPSGSLWAQRGVSRKTLQPVYTMKLYSTDPNQRRHIFDIIIVRAPRLSLDDGGRQVVLSAAGCCHGAV